MEQYYIYEGHMNALRKKVATIQKKCKRFGCEFHFAEVGTEIRTVKDLDGNDVNCNFVIVEAEGTAKINDWEFVGSVEHTNKGNIFSKAMTDLEIPERYRFSSCFCEHCNSHRSRSATFIVHNSVTNEFKQVGRSCLRDFTFGMSAESAVFFASLKEVFEEAQSTPVSCGWSAQYFDTKEILSFTAETIRHFGFAKSDSPDSTRSRTEQFMTVWHGHTRWMPEEQVQMIKSQMKKVEFNPQSKEAQEMVQNAVEWIQNQEDRTDYIHNLKVAVANEYSHWGRFGLLVSLFPAFDRDLELQAQRNEELKKGAMSKHIGNVGDRIEITVKDINCITSWESSFNGSRPVTTYVWKIIDTEGNQFTWKTSKWIDMENLPQSIKGTVKEHKEFRGIKQTELTRCKVMGI